MFGAAAKIPVGMIVIALWNTVCTYSSLNKEAPLLAIAGGGAS